MRRAAFALAVLALCSCSWLGGEKPVRLGPIYSPNGEPLSGGPLDDPSCDDALGRWLGRADTDHDGTIDEREFLADASRQFAAMDLEKTGVLTPSVLAQYRTPYARANAARQRDDRDRDQDQRERDEGRGPPPEEERADPVMLADVGLRNRVTRDDFLAYARRNFATLDLNHDGRLDRDEVLATCKR